MRFSAGLKGFLALSMLQLSVAARVSADDDPCDVATRTAESAESDAGDDKLDKLDKALDALQAEAYENPLESHRRRAGKSVTAAEAQPSSRRTAQAVPIEVTEFPMERLNRLCAGEVELTQPIIVSPTLAEAMRRVAMWGDHCPFCGQAHAAKNTSGDLMPAAETNGVRGKLLDVDRSDDNPAEKPNAQPLRAGEPAQVILDTQKRLGKSVLEGTEFSGSPELLIQWIRVLDEENRRRLATLDETARAEVDVLTDEASTVSHRSQIEALREACRDLQQVADLLEDQNLFDSADSIRGFADVLRRQSRQKLSHVEPTGDDTAPLSEPRHANSKR